MNSLRQWAKHIGKAALPLFFASAFLAPAVANFGLVLMTAAFPIAAADWRILLRQPVLLAVLACAAYLIALTVALSLDPPQAIAVHWNGLWAWLQLALFIPVAFFLREDSEDLWRLLLLCLFGLVIGSLWRLDWARLLHSPWDYLHSGRDNYGFPGNDFALFSGTALLGIVLLRRRWWANSFARILLWIVCLFLLSQGFVVTQARGSWISLVVAAAFAFVLGLRYRQVTAGSPRARILGYAVVVLPLLVLAVTQRQMIVSRLIIEMPVVQSIISGKPESVGTSSFTLRWNAQLFGAETWLRRPLTGWGPATSQELMAISGNPKLEYESGKVITHLHNTYLELLVQTGVIGFVLAGVLIALLLRGLVLAFRADQLAPDLYLFLLSAFVFLLLCSFSDFRAMRQDWRFYWILLAGTAFSFCLRVDTASPSVNAPAGGGR